MRRLLIWGGVFVLALVLAGGAAWLEIQTRLSPVSDTSQQIIVTIPRGAAAAEIGRILEKAGVIRSAQAFRYLAAFKHLGPKLKAGEHILNPGLNTPEVLEALVQGRFKLYRLTVPEGLTMVQVAALAAEKGLADEREFLTLCRDQEFICSLGFQVKTLEGYLFPETYYFVRGTTTREVVKAMTLRFQQVWRRYQPLAKTQNLSRREIVTLASIIEKETGAEFERPLIASVFLNRLRRGMRLETDPTVIYGLKNFDGNLTRKHLETYTPYNTYRITGLPPGPIANPGEESIKAVFEPAKTDYLFFVSKNDGTHHFSKTLSEHNRAVARYQKRAHRR